MQHFRRYPHLIPTRLTEPHPSKRTVGFVTAGTHIVTLLNHTLHRQKIANAEEAMKAKRFFEWVVRQATPVPKF